MRYNNPNWPDLVVIRQIKSAKLNFIDGVYDDKHRLRGAKLYEQSFSFEPELEKNAPQFVKDVDLMETPIAFSQSGGFHWRLNAQGECSGYKIIKSGNSLSQLKEVSFTVYYNFGNKQYTRGEMTETGKNLLFTTFDRLKCTVRIDGELCDFVPIYILPECTKYTVVIKDNKPYYVCDDKTDKLTFVGGNVYKKTHELHFYPLQNLPDEVIRFFD